MFARGTHRRATHKHKTMILPKDPVAVLCDIDEACKLFKELREAGVPCLRKDEVDFREVFRGYPFIGILWGYSSVIGSLMKHNADLAVPMPEFRTAFGLNPQQEP